MPAYKTLAAAAAILSLSAVAAGTASAQDVVAYRPLTVAPGHHYYQPVQPVAPAYDPYRGPGVIVTGPVHLAGTIATAPFRAINGVFPPQGSPLAIVGAPVYIAGRLVALPFRIAEAPFGGPNPFQD